MKVRTLKACFVGGKRRKGEVFDFTPPVIDGKEIMFPKILEPIVPRGGPAAAAPAKKAAPVSDDLILGK